MEKSRDSDQGPGPLRGSELLRGGQPWQPEAGRAQRARRYRPTGGTSERLYSAARRVSPSMEPLDNRKMQKGEIPTQEINTTSARNLMQGPAPNLASAPASACPPQKHTGCHGRYGTVCRGRRAAHAARPKRAPHAPSALGILGLVTTSSLATGGLAQPHARWARKGGGSQPTALPALQPRHFPSRDSLSTSRNPAPVRWPRRRLHSTADHSPASASGGSCSPPGLGNTPAPAVSSEQRLGQSPEDRSVPSSFLHPLSPALRARLLLLLLSGLF